MARFRQEQEPALTTPPPPEDLEAQLDQPNLDPQMTDPQAEAEPLEALHGDRPRGIDGAEQRRYRRFETKDDKETDMREGCLKGRLGGRSS